METNPYAGPATSSTALGSDERLPHELWSYLPGLYFSVLGVIYTLTCVLSPIGIPMSLIGVAFLRAGQSVSGFNRSLVGGGAGDDLAALTATAQIVRAMRLYGVFMAVVFVLYAALLAVVVLLAVLENG